MHVKGPFNALSFYFHLKNLPQSIESNVLVIKSIDGQSLPATIASHHSHLLIVPSENEEPGTRTKREMCIRIASGKGSDKVSNASLLGYQLVDNRSTTLRLQSQPFFASFSKAQRTN
jgi:hypothetical protein